MAVPPPPQTHRVLDEESFITKIWYNYFLEFGRSLVENVSGEDALAVRHPYIHLENTQVKNAGGGTATSDGTWKTLTVNTEITDTHNLCTLSSDMITLSAGTYLVRAFFPFYNTQETQIRFYNDSDTSVERWGKSGYVANTTDSFDIVGQFSITAEKNFYFQYQVGNTQNNNGQGRACNFDEEHYGQVEFWQVAT